MLLEKLPVPVITSDRNGVVKFMNHSMTHLLGKDEGRDGATFFDLLAPPGRQGETISSYLSRFSARSKNSDSTIQVQIHGQEYLAKTRLMESSVPQIIVSVIEKSPR
jgi:PAS domain-containing protein